MDLLSPSKKAKSASKRSSPRVLESLSHDHFRYNVEEMNPRTMSQEEVEAQFMIAMNEARMRMPERASRTPTKSIPLTTMESPTLRPEKYIMTVDERLSEDDLEKFSAKLCHMSPTPIRRMTDNFTSPLRDVSTRKKISSLIAENTDLWLKVDMLKKMIMDLRSNDEAQDEILKKERTIHDLTMKTHDLQEELEATNRSLQASNKATKFQAKRLKLMEERFYSVQNNTPTDHMQRVLFEKEEELTVLREDLLLLKGKIQDMEDQKKATKNLKIDLKVTREKVTHLINENAMLSSTHGLELQQLLKENDKLKEQTSSQMTELQAVRTDLETVRSTLTEKLDISKNSENVSLDLQKRLQAEVQDREKAEETSQLTQSRLVHSLQSIEKVCTLTRKKDASIRRLCDELNKKEIELHRLREEDKSIQEVEEKLRHSKAQSQSFRSVIKELRKESNTAKSLESEQKERASSLEEKLWITQEKFQRSQIRMQTQGKTKDKKIKDLNAKIRQSTPRKKTNASAQSERDWLLNLRFDEADELKEMVNNLEEKMKASNSRSTDLRILNNELGVQLKDAQEEVVSLEEKLSQSNLLENQELENMKQEAMEIRQELEKVEQSEEFLTEEHHLLKAKEFMNQKKLEEVQISEESLKEELNSLKINETKLTNALKSAKISEEKLSKELESGKISEEKLTEELDLAKTSEEKLTEELESAKISEQKLTEELEVAKISEEKLTEELESARDAWRLLQKGLQSFQTTEENLTAELVSAKAKIEILEDRNITKKEKIEELENRNITTRKSCDMLVMEFSAVKRARDSFKLELDTTKTNLEEELEATMRTRDTMEQKLASAQSSRHTLERKLSWTKNSQYNLEQELANSKVTRDNLEEEVAAAKTTWENLEEELSSTKAQLVKSKDEALALKTEILGLQTTRENLEQELSTTKAQLVKSKEEAQALKTNFSDFQAQLVNSKTTLELLKKNFGNFKEQSKERIGELNSELVDARISEEEMLNTIESMQTKHKAKDTEYEERIERLMASKAQLHSILETKKMNEFEERIKSVMVSKAQLESLLETKETTHRAKLTEFEERIKSLTASKAQLQSLLETEETAHKAKMTDVEERIKSLIASKAQLHSKLETNKKKHEAKMDIVEERIETLMASKAQLLKMLEAKKEELEATNISLQAANEAASNTERILKEAKENASTAKRKWKEANKELEETYIRLQASNEELEATNISLQASYETASTAKRKLEEAISPVMLLTSHNPNSLNFPGESGIEMGKTQARKSRIELREKLRLKEELIKNMRKELGKLESTRKINDEENTRLLEKLRENLKTVESNLEKEESKGSKNELQLTDAKLKLIESHEKCNKMRELLDRSRAKIIELKERQISFESSMIQTHLITEIMPEISSGDGDTDNVDTTAGGVQGVRANLRKLIDTLGSSLTTASNQLQKLVEANEETKSTIELEISLIFDAVKPILQNLKAGLKALEPESKDQTPEAPVEHRRRRKSMWVQGNEIQDLAVDRKSHPQMSPKRRSTLMRVSELSATSPTRTSMLLSRGKSKRVAFDLGSPKSPTSAKKNREAYLQRRIQTLEEEVIKQQENLRWEKLQTERISNVNMSEKQIQEQETQRLSMLLDKKEKTIRKLNADLKDTMRWANAKSPYFQCIVTSPENTPTNKASTTPTNEKKADKFLQVLLMREEDRKARRQSKLIKSKHLIKEMTNIKEKAIEIINEYPPKETPTKSKDKANLSATQKKLTKEQQHNLSLLSDVSRDDDDKFVAICSEMVDEIGSEINHSIPNHKSGFTLLHRMAAAGSVKGVRAILEFNHADPNVQSDKGTTPLHTVCRRLKLTEMRNIMIALVVAGGDLGVVNDEGKSPLSLIHPRELLVPIITKLQRLTFDGKRQILTELESWAKW